MADPTRSRPAMRNYGIAQAPEGMLDWKWVTEQARRSRNYWICATRPDGNPHAAPVWGVWLDDTIYFGTARTSRKARNLAQNPRVVAHLESGDDVVIIEGAVEEVTDAALFARFADAYAAKYAPIRPEQDAGTVYYRVRPQVVMAWTEADFPNTATRWDFAD